jgi:hypothetical protein
LEAEMEPEVLSQGLDAAAFILVTPEFLGEGRVEWLRSLLNGLILWYGREIRVPALTTFRGLLSFGAAYIFLGFVFVSLSRTLDRVGAVHGVLWYLQEGLSVLLFVAGTLCMVGIFTVVTFLILKAITFGLVRIFIFGIGAICFFTSRAIMIWAAQHGH